MARSTKPPRILKWRGSYYLFFHDYSRTPPVARRISLDALGARSAAQRAETVKKYTLDEKIQTAEVITRGGALAYDTNLIKALERYKQANVDRVRTRVASPKVRSRGLSARSRVLLDRTVNGFTSWLIANKLEHLRTGQLDAMTISRYLDAYAAKQFPRGDRLLSRSEATVAMETRHLRVAFRALDDFRPPLFPDFSALKNSLRPRPGRPPKNFAYTPPQLVEFLRAALAREDAGRLVEVVRHRGGSIEHYTQHAHSVSAVPASRLFLLLALIGARLGDTLLIQWSDIDLDKGLVTFWNPQKTGIERVVPLVRAPEIDIAPTFLELLRAWQREAAGRRYVLPHGELDKPIEPINAWRGTNEAVAVRVNAQNLRKSFSSYCAALGVPASTVALWQGHRVAVAEQYYRQQVLERVKGKTLEAALGLEQLIKQMLSTTRKRSGNK